MKSILFFAFAAALFAQQQPSIENAKLETRALSGSLSAELSRLGAGPLWVGYSEAIIPNHNSTMCSYDGNNYSGMSANAPLRLEGAAALVVLIRIEDGQLDQMRVTSPDCRLDVGGLPFYWLTGVSTTESITWLKSQITGRHSDSAIMAIALHRDQPADQVLEELTSPSTQSIEIRKRVATWLGNSRGAQGVAMLKKMLGSDPSPDVRDRVVLALSQTKDPGGMPLVIEAARSDKDPHIRGQALTWLAQRASRQISTDTIQHALASDTDSSVRDRAVQALGQMPNGEGVPLLINVAKTNQDPAIRKKAMNVLGQSKDPRALDFFAQVLK